MAAVAFAVKKKQEAKRESRRKEEDVEVASIFEKYDTDGGGDIDKAELASALKDLGLGTVPKAKLQGLIVKYSNPGSNALDIDAFSMLVADLKAFAKKKAPAPVEPFVKNSILGKGKPLPYQAAVRRIYMHPACVWTVAGIIIANFLINCIEKEIDADANDMKYAQTWYVFDFVFNMLFLVVCPPDV